MSDDTILKSKSASLNERSICFSHGYVIYNNYLGGGAVGRVFLGEARPAKIEASEKLKLIRKIGQPLKVAIKIIYADGGADLVRILAKYLPNEISNMQKGFGHPNIIMLLDVFVSCKRIFLVMEFASRGTLDQIYLDLITRKKHPYMDEDEARYYFREIISGLDHLHQQHVAHRDIKFENILVVGDGRVKLCDLGFSTTSSGCDESQENMADVTCDMGNITRVGTPAFMAPELSETASGYNALSADMWSIGVVLFALVNGCYPRDNEVEEESKKIGKQFAFRKSLSKECKSLLLSLLDVSPSKRPNTGAVMKHPWMKGSCKKPDALKSDVIAYEDIKRIKLNRVYDFQAKYVRNYLLQRAELLSTTRDMILNDTKLPIKVLSEFGIRILLPRQDTEGKRIEEIWRVDVVLRKFDNNSNETYIKVDDVKPSCGLHISCDWSPVDKTLTVGIPPVKRIVRNLPLIAEWLEVRRENEAPLTEMEKCVQLCNTVDLDVGEPWPLKEEITRPEYEWVNNSRVLASGENSDQLHASDFSSLNLVPVFPSGNTAADVLVINFPSTLPDVTLEPKYLQEFEKESADVGVSNSAKNLTFILIRDEINQSKKATSRQSWIVEKQSSNQNTGDESDASMEGNDTRAKTIDELPQKFPEKQPLSVNTTIIVSSSPLHSESTSGSTSGNTETPETSFSKPQFYDELRLEQVKDCVKLRRLEAGDTVAEPADQLEGSRQLEMGEVRKKRQSQTGSDVSVSEKNLSDGLAQDTNNRMQFQKIGCTNNKKSKLCDSTSNPISQEYETLTLCCQEGGNPESHLTSSSVREIPISKHLNNDETRDEESVSLQKHNNTTIIIMSSVKEVKHDLHCNRKVEADDEEDDDLKSHANANVPAMKYLGPVCKVESVERDHLSTKHQHQNDDELYLMLPQVMKDGRNKFDSFMKGCEQFEKTTKKSSQNMSEEIDESSQTREPNVDILEAYEEVFSIQDQHGEGPEEIEEKLEQLQTKNEVFDNQRNPLKSEPEQTIKTTPLYSRMFQKTITSASDQEHIRKSSRSSFKQDLPQRKMVKQPLVCVVEKNIRRPTRIRTVPNLWPPASIFVPIQVPYKKVDACCQTINPVNPALHSILTTIDVGTQTEGLMEPMVVTKAASVQVNNSNLLNGSDSLCTVDTHDVTSCLSDDAKRFESHVRLSSDVTNSGDSQPINDCLEQNEEDETSKEMSGTSKSSRSRRRGSIFMRILPRFVRKWFKRRRRPTINNGHPKDE